MFCVSGFSGAGKDEFVRRLVQRGAEQTGLADPAKRHMADVYGFTEEQLFGPSAFRNAGDMRFPKNTLRLVKASPFRGEIPAGIVGRVEPDARYWAFAGRSSELSEGLPYEPLQLGASKFFVKEGDPKFWLSPRESLQLYCELMNNLDINTWIRKGVEDQLLIATGEYSYSRMKGVYKGSHLPHPTGHPYVTCFADFRHIHEIRYVRSLPRREDLKIAAIRVKRPGLRMPPYRHRSETEQVQIRDSAFDFVVENDSNVEDLHRKADAILDTVMLEGWRSLSWSDSCVVEDRKPTEGYAP